METVNALTEALEQTRVESNGITLDLVARTIRKVYSGEEVEYLIERLEALKD